MPIQVRRGRLCLSTDRQRLDHAAVLALLRTAYWGGSLTPEILARAIENSVCFAVLDVVVAEAYRRQGIGRWLSETMLAHPQLQGLRRVSLLTRDAASLYTQLGFTQSAGSLTYMEHRDRDSRG